MFEGYKGSLEKLKEMKIDHTELGEVNSFIQCQTQKDMSIDFLSHILVSVEDLKIDLDPYIDLINSQCESYITNLEQQCNQINSIVANNGVYNQNFPIQRQNIQNWFSQNMKSLKSTFRVLELNMELVLLQNYQNSIGVKDIVEENEKIKNELKKAQDEINIVLNKARDLASQKTMINTKSTYLEIKTNHYRTSRKWFWAMIVSILPIAAGIIWLLFFPQNFDPTSNTYKNDLIVNYMQKLSLIFLPLFSFRICLTKYNTENHLVIVYAHRIAALEQYSIFEASIHNDDRDAKNAFRLEIAKNLLGDPQTGYIKENNDIPNINPIVTLIEKIGKP
jgi:hypothetical protein